MPSNKEIEASTESLRKYIDSHKDYSKQPNATSQDAYIYHAAKAALEAAEAAKWQPIKTAPRNTKILVHFKNSHNKTRIALAIYFPKFSIEYNGDVDNWADINDDGDYFCPEGWYEDIQSEVSEYGYFKLDYEPDLWQPVILPQPPKGE